MSSDAAKYLLCAFCEKTITDNPGYIYYGPGRRMWHELCLYAQMKEQEAERIAETHQMVKEFKSRHYFENPPNGLACVTDMHGRVYDWDDARDQ